MHLLPDKPATQSWTVSGGVIGALAMLVHLWAPVFGLDSEMQDRIVKTLVVFATLATLLGVRRIFGKLVSGSAPQPEEESK